MKTRVSLKDIAEKLNFSITTVSWVLNGQAEKKGISKSTQDIVLNCAKEMKYQPNLIARSLNLGQTKTIGLIIPSISDFFYSSIAREIENQASQHGYSLMIASSESNFNKEELVLQMFKSKGVDGIIIAPTKQSKVEIEHLISEKFPLVTFDRYFPELQTSYIIIDNKESSYKLTKHLIEKGSKKIALITTNSHLTTMNERNEGYKQALSDSGIKYNPVLIGNVEYEDYENKIIKVLDNIFEKVSDIDGFFFTTHILALEAFLYFNNKGIDFNRQFKLACIHEVSLFKILAPEINIAKMPITDIGKNAVDILLEEIRAKKEQLGEKGQYKVVLPCTLYLHK